MTNKKAFFSADDQQQQSVPTTPASPTSPLSQYSLNFFHQPTQQPAQRRMMRRHRRAPPLGHSMSTTSSEKPMEEGTSDKWNSNGNNTVGIGDGVGAVQQQFHRQHHYQIQAAKNHRLTLHPNADFRPGTPPPSTPIRREALSYDPTRLAPPSVYELGLTRGEAPPHKRDTVEKIPIRARSQSWLIRTRHLLDDEKLNRQVPIISKCLFILSVVLLVLTFPFCIPFCLRVSKEYERAVVFRLGRLIKKGTKGPGMFFIMPCIDTYKMVDLRVLSFDVPPQEILSRDSVTVSVEAVIYFRISNPVISVTNVNDAQFSTKLLAQTTLRNVLGTKTLSEILMERDVISSIIEKVLDDGTDPWGVKVERVEIKDIRLPQQLMKSMAAEAEAARDARANVIAADGERNASRQLVEAANVVAGNRVSLQLRYLQTLIRISAQHNHTYVVPIPLEVVKRFLHKMKKRA